MERMYKGVLTESPHPTDLDVRASYMVVNAESVYKALLSLLHQFKESEDEVRSDMYLSVYRFNSVSKKWIYETTRRISSL